MTRKRPHELKDGTLALPCGTIRPADDYKGWLSEHLPYCATCIGNYGAHLMTTNSRPGTYSIDPRAERFEAIAREASWRMDQREKRDLSHRCGVCFGPYGKSSIRCRNEP